MSSIVEQKDIEKFFHSYCSAFSVLDEKAVAMHYEFPALFVHQHGNTVFTNIDSLEKNIEALCQHYQAQGFSSASCTLTNHMPRKNGFCLIDVSWVIKRKNSVDHSFSTTYLLAKRSDSWKISCVLANEEVL